MKDLNITFTDHEFNVMLKEKNKSKLVWHDFIIECVKAYGGKK